MISLVLQGSTTGSFVCLKYQTATKRNDMSQQKIQELTAVLNQASSDYYKGETPPMSDMEFDSKLKELEKTREGERFPAPK